MNAFATWRRRLHGDAVVYAVAAIVTTVLTWFVYNVRDLTWRVPGNYSDSGDGMFIMANIKADLETGWYENQSLLAAPYGQSLHDFKTADNLPHVVFNVLGLFTDDFGTAMNAYFFLGFPLAALTAVWFLRLVGVSRSLSAALAIMYALAPYHFYRGQGHMWLGEYWAVPLGLGIVVKVAAGRRVWGRRRNVPRALGWLTGPTVGTLAALTLVAMSNSYYGLWTLELIAVAGLVRFIATRDVRLFLGAAAAGAWVVAVAVANMLPDLLYARANGANPTAVQRLPHESEIYSFKLAQLLLPADFHRVGPLRSLRQYYDQAYPLPSEHPVLGVVTAVGLVIALCSAVHLLMSPRSRARRHAFFSILVSLTLLCFLIGTVGGISTLLSFLTSDLRGANRIAIFIAMLSLAVLGLALDTAVRRATHQWSRPVAMATAVGVAAAVVGVGYFDQVPPGLGDYTKNNIDFKRDSALVAAIEDDVPRGARILQLPYFAFPENPPVNGASYADQLMPHLHSKTLRWSGGAIKGRPKAEWVNLGNDALGWKGLVSAATLGDFDGVLLDKKAFVNRRDIPTAELTSLLGQPTVTAGRYAFYNTAALARSLRDVPATARDDIVDRLFHPTLARFEPNFGQSFNYPETLKSYRPRFEIDNAQQVTTRIDLSFTIQSRTGDGRLRLRFPDGTSADIDVAGGPLPQTIQFDAPPGRSTISIEIIDGPKPSNLSGADSGPLGVDRIRTADPKLVAAVNQLPSVKQSGPES